MEKPECRNCCYYLGPTQTFDHVESCFCHEMYGDGREIIRTNKAPYCKHYDVKKCKTCGYYSNLFGDQEDIALCTCYGKCDDDDFIEIPKDNVAVDCEYYYYDPQED